MIYFMLNNLRGPAGIGLEPRFKSLVLILHFNRAVSFCFPRSGERQAAFFCLIRPEDFMISGLNMTEAVPLSSKIMILLATPIMFAAIPTQPTR